MNSEIEKVLEMHKSGSISSEQASALIRELNDEPFEKLRAKAEEKSFTEKILDHVSRFTEMKHEHHQHFRQHWQHHHGYDQHHGPNNRNFASKVEPPTGTEFKFIDNSFITSHVHEFQLTNASMQNCKGVNSNLHEFELKEAQIETCSFINTHAKEVRLENSHFRDLKIVNTELKELVLLDESHLIDSAIKACSIQELSLKEGSEITEAKFYAIAVDRFELKQSQLRNVEIFAAKMKDISFIDSSWMDIICKENRFKNFRMTRSHFNDVVFSGHHKFKKSVFEDVHFEDCFLKKIMFNDCKLDNIVFKNITAENLSFRGLRLKDQVIDGNNALNEILKSTGV